MTYKQWRERIDERYGKAQVDIKQKMLRNAKSDAEQLKRYKAVLGKDAPKSLAIFQELKYLKTAEWEDLQEKYRYTGIVDRLLKNNPSAVVLNKGDKIPKEYLKAARSLSRAQKEGIYHYSHYPEGVKMNKFLGSVPGVSLTSAEMEYLQNTVSALDNMVLPCDTIVWRGTEAKLLKGFDEIKNLPISEWKGRPLSTDGFTSTSIYKELSYSKEVQMVILVPKEMSGAGYINEISYNKMNKLPEEHEILLQKSSNYSIIEAQKFNKKTILVVRWEGHDG